MTTRWLRFRDLEARGIVASWTQLKRLIGKYEFPPGRMLSPNIRAWAEEEIDEWFKSRPVEGPPPRGAAKQKRDRRRKAGADASATAA